MPERKNALWRIVAVLSITVPIIGQVKPQFDVVSVKANNSGTGFVRIGGQPAAGRFVATNATVEMLVTWAYRIQNYAISGGPGWMVTDRFDIEARADAGALTPDQMAQMVQSLLADRFFLKTHRATTEGSVYVLVVGKNGVKMKRSADQSPFGGRGARGGAPPQGEPGPRGRGAIAFDGPPGERRGGPLPPGGVRMAPGFLQIQGVSMAMLAEFLAQQLGRPVIDKTGAYGSFDISLEWATDLNFAGPGPGGLRGPDIGLSTSGPSLFTAVEEQLGLRLESAKGPVETLVIDSVQRPQEN
jgi:uncharacterized protein (TIGR03435 family)